MSKNLMDTMEINEIRKLIGDTRPDDSEPLPPVTGMHNGDMDLDDIIAEIHGKPAQKNAANPLPQHDFKAAGVAAPAKPAAAPPKPEPDSAVQPQPKSSWPVNRKKEKTHDLSITEEIELRQKHDGVIRQPTASHIRDITEETRTQMMQSVNAKEEKTEKPIQEQKTAQDRVKASESSKIKGQNTGRLQNTSRLQNTGRLRARGGRNEIGNIELLDREESEDAQAYDEDDFQEQEEIIRDPKLASRACGRRAKSLKGRSVPVFVLFLGACYISFAGTFSLPLPDVISYTKTPFISLLTLISLQVLSMFLAIDIVGMGLYYLFTFKPTYSSMVSVSLFASLAHSISIILFPDWGGYLPYNAVAMCTLYAAMLSEAHRFAGRQRTYKAATLTETPVGVYAHEELRDGARRSVKFRMEDLTDFLRQIEKPDLYDKLGRVYTPLALVAAVVFAALSSFGRGEATRFLWAFSAILSAAAPLSLLTAFGLPYKNVARKLLAEGAAIAGLRPAARLRRTTQAALTDGDLFPAGTVTIEGLKVFGNNGVEKVLSYAAAVIDGSGSDIGRIFAETLRERYGRPVKATNILHYESGGMSAEIFTDSVLVGTASFVMRMGIRVQEGKNIKNGVFVVINSEIAGIFALKYYPSAQTYGALHTFQRQKMRLVLATRDFSITPAMIESIFELKRGSVDSPEVNQRLELSDLSYVEGDEVCGILSRDGITPFAECVQAAGKLTSAVISNLIIGVFAGICGMLLMFYFTYIFAPDAAVPYNVLFYLLLWYVPTYFISHNAKSGY